MLGTVLIPYCSFLNTSHSGAYEKQAKKHGAKVLLFFKRAFIIFFQKIYKIVQKSAIYNKKTRPEDAFNGKIPLIAVCFSPSIWQARCRCRAGRRV